MPEINVVCKICWSNIPELQRLELKKPAIYTTAKPTVKERVKTVMDDLDEAI
jgi:hypothetical protein